MEKSYEEIRKVLNYMDKSELEAIIFKGSENFLKDETSPADSPAARDLASRAMDYSSENPLYVIAIGAITNVASALLINPRIRDRIVVIWLGGCAHHWPHNREFNLRQDVAGGRILFGSGTALVQVPAHGVAGSFRTGAFELEHWLRGKNRISDYLLENTLREARDTNAGPVWTRAIWDVVPAAWLLEGDFVQDYLVHSPIPEYDHRYSFSPERHLIRYVYNVNRDALFLDLFTKLTK